LPKPPNDRSKFGSLNHGTQHVTSNRPAPVPASAKHDGGQPISKPKNPGSLNVDKARPNPEAIENENPIVGGTSDQGGTSARLILQDNQKVPPSPFKLNFI